MASTSSDPEAFLPTSVPPTATTHLGEQEPLVKEHGYAAIISADNDGSAGNGADISTAVSTRLHDAYDTVVLGVPIFLAMLSWIGMKTTDSALLGHVSADALAAAALSDIWTMCTAVFIQGRVLGVLIGAAVGAGNPKLAGMPNCFSDELQTKNGASDFPHLQ